MGLKRKAAFLTLGCKVNQYETDAMEELLRGAGYQIVDFSNQADVYIINTCSVTNMADRKSRQMIHRARRKNPEAVVAAVGCYVQTGGRNLLENKQADILIGNNRKKDIVQILESYFSEKNTEDHSFDRVTDHDAAEQMVPKQRDPVWSYVHDIARDRDYEDLSLHNVTGHTRAYLKIQDGCNQFCSYCIIPYARGRIRSRNPREVVEEVRRLTEQGFREIVLTGIHLSSYGLDLTDEKAASQGAVQQESSPQAGGEDKEILTKEASGKPGKVNPYLRGPVSLLTIIEDLQKIPGLARIRLSSLEPRIITEEFVRGIKACDKVCPHFHLSLQSGCDATLARMNRKYSTSEYREAVDLLRAVYDQPAITTDVIAGFVGETEEEFEETRRFLEEIRLYEMHIFKYSVREGTRAQKMQGHLPDHIKAARSGVLLQMAERFKRAFEESFIGREVEVLLEEEILIDGRSYWQGFTDRYVKIFVENDKKYHKFSRNTLVRVKIIGFLPQNFSQNSLYGKVS